MPIKILMPALSPTMLEGNLTKWKKKEGDKITAGEVIAEIETDKATMEVEAVEEGVIAKILIPEGSENIAVNSLIAVLLEDGEDPDLIDEFIKNNLKTLAPSVASEINLEIKNKDLNLEQEVASSSLGSSKTSRIFISPLAKKLAEINKINFTQVRGTGPHGRIIKQDIVNYAKETSNNATQSKSSYFQRDPVEYKTVQNSNIRKIIAKRLLESKQTIPHFYLSIECNMDKLLGIREDVNKAYANEKSIKISVNDFIILAVAKALREVPKANASWSDSGINYYNNIDISVAVAIEDGLITPVLRNADHKKLVDLSNEMKILANKARENKLTPEEFQGGGFTISNLGMYGIKQFNAIINPPQSCILAVGASSKRPIIIKDQLKIATIMDVTLSSDHRVVDGAVGAQFLAAFKKFIESPALLLI